MLKKLILSILFLALSTPAYATSTANVEVNNSVSTNSNSNTTSHTEVTVETNGKTTYYESDKPGSVNIKSVNGETTIKVDDKDVSPTQVDKETKPTISPSPANLDESNKEEEMEIKNKNFIQKLTEEINFLKKKLFFWEH